jgi:uncharacterized membrane protein YjjP (DUF1212 family)
MLNIISILVGVLALLIALPGLLPLLGWLNWLVLPIAAVGLIAGVLSRSSAGRNLNIVVLIVAAVRLMLGGGLL